MWGTEIKIIYIKCSLGERKHFLLKGKKKKETYRIQRVIFPSYIHDHNASLGESLHVKNGTLL